MLVTVTGLVTRHVTVCVPETDVGSAGESKIAPPFAVIGALKDCQTAPSTSQLPEIVPEWLPYTCAWAV